MTYYVARSKGRYGFTPRIVPETRSYLPEIRLVVRELNDRWCYCHRDVTQFMFGLVVFGLVWHGF